MTALAVATVAAIVAALMFVWHDLQQHIDRLNADAASVEDVQTTEGTGSFGGHSRSQRRSA